MTAPSFTTPPPAPIRGDATTFSARFAAFLTWMTTFVSEEEIAVAWLEAMALDVDTNAGLVAQAVLDVDAAANLALAGTNLVAKSASSLVVGAGSKSLTFLAPATGFQVNDLVVLVLRSDPSVKMYMTVDTFNGTTAMTGTVVSGGVFGSGTYSNWLVISAAFLSASATDADVQAGVSTYVAMTPSNMDVINGNAIAFASAL